VRSTTSVSQDSNFGEGQPSSFASPEQRRDAFQDLADVADVKVAGTHQLFAVRSELLTRPGRPREARAELENAARLCPSERERAP
jgi:predicted RNA polymerase sigma factor